MVGYIDSFENRPMPTVDYSKLMSRRFAGTFQRLSTNSAQRHRPRRFTSSETEEETIWHRLNHALAHRSPELFDLISED